MRSLRSGVAVVAAVSLVPLGLGSSVARAADPSGTVGLGGTVPSKIELLGATEAGIFYSTDSSIGGDKKYWLKAGDAAPVQSPFTYLGFNAKMAGRTVYDDNFPKKSFSYSISNGPIRTCAYPAGHESLHFVPDGGLYVDAGAVKKVVAGNLGCTTITVLPAATGVTIAAIAGGDEKGFALDTVQPGGAKRLAYYPYADVTKLVTLNRPLIFYPRDDQSMMPNLQAGALLGYASSTNYRVPIDGSKTTVLPEGQWTAMTKTVVAGFYAGSLRSIPVTGGAQQSKAGAESRVVADGTSIYSQQMAGEAPGIYRRTSATGTATLVVPLPTKRYPTAQFGVAVQPGRISYTNGQRVPEWEQEFDVITRTTSVVGGKLVLGAEQTLATKTGWAALSGSAGWLQYRGNLLRDPFGVVTKLPDAASAPPQASGNRIVLKLRYYDGGAINWSYPVIRDLRTNKYVEIPDGPTDLFGNYLAYAKPDGSVRVKDLARNVEGVHRPAGTKIAAVAVHGKWVAWVAGSSAGAQTLTIRNTATKTQQNIATRGTTSLKLSGGYLALDVKPGTQRELRTIKLGTTTPVVIGTLPATPYEANPPDIFDAAPDQFDMDDETLAWTDKDHLGKAVQLGAFIDPPAYLGNVIAPASMSTTWSMRLPVSKALPTCQVTIFYGSTKVRILNCANKDGMVKVTWDGKSGSGGKLVKGKYTYRVTGQDADKYNLRNYNGTLTHVGGSITKTV